MGWALPEGIRGSSLTQDLEGDFGAVLIPGVKNKKLDGKRDRGLFFSWHLPQVSKDPMLAVAGP